MITKIPTIPLAFNSSIITPLYITSNLRPSFPPFPFPFLSSPRLKLSHRRRTFHVQASSLVLPLLPFPIDQVLVPSEGKTLHLYEARYIALLEESLFQKNKVFVHFVLDPIGFTGSSGEASFAARFGCLVLIEKVERLEIGALVEIRGVGRVKILELKQLQNNFTMVRSKIRYELIADERTRRETFKKRKTGLFKKLNELKTLCDVEACGIIINGEGTQSEVWPSPHEASAVVQKFVNLPSSSQTNNMTDQAGFLRQNLSRISKNLGKETVKVQSLERELLLVECLTKEEVDVSNSKELHEMLRLLESKIGMLDRRFAEIEPCSSNRVAGAKGTNIEPQHGKGQPYLTGEVTPLQDNVFHEMTETSAKILELKQALYSLTILEIKLKAPGEASLQTQTVNSLNWAEKQLSLDSITDFIPPLAERVSFVALQPISGASLSELAKLQREKVTAMDTRDTVVRLEKSIELTKHNISMLAAKLAIQSLGKR